MNETETQIVETAKNGALRLELCDFDIKNARGRNWLFIWLKEGQPVGRIRAKDGIPDSTWKAMYGRRNTLWCVYRTAANQVAPPFTLAVVNTYTKTRDEYSVSASGKVKRLRAKKKKFKKATKAR